MGHVLVGISGASGGVYGVRLVQRLLQAGIQTDLVLTGHARQVLAIEQGLGGDAAAWFDGGALEVLDNGDLTAPPASGSSAPEAMIVVPCSMGSAARIAAGFSSTLLERAADVMLKERRPLVLVPRETPLSTLHLRNLLTLSELGARVVPACPAFYTGPADVEDMLAFVVDRAIQSAGLALPLRHAWRAPSARTDP